MYKYIRNRIRNWYKRIFRPSSLQYEGPFNFFLIDDDPIIILTFTPCGLGHVKTMAEKVSPRPCHFLVGFWWSMKDVGRVDAFQRNWSAIQSKHPSMDLQVLCNAEAEQDLFEERTDISAHHVNQNCMLDEEMWDIMDIDSKKYDAIYNARIGKYKRIELANEVNNLAIITAPYDKDIEDDEYAHKLRKHMSHADWLNFEQGEYRRLSSDEVHNHVSHAHVGLILSGTEGACYAVGEYLLSGVPVVSTPSEGGRDVWFNSETCILVDETPKAVAEGVAQWKRRTADPYQIRRVTLDKVNEHRDRFFGIVDSIREEYGKNKYFKNEWEDRSINKMRIMCDKDDFGELINIERFNRRVEKMR